MEDKANAPDSLTPEEVAYLWNVAAVPNARRIDASETRLAGRLGKLGYLDVEVIRADGGFYASLTIKGREALARATAPKQAASPPPGAPAPQADSYQQGRLAGLREAADLLEVLTRESCKRVKRARFALEEARAVRDARQDAASRLVARVEKLAAEQGKP